MHRHVMAAVALGLSVGLCADPCSADGMPKTSDPYAYSPEPVALEYNWTGVYLGGHAGIATAQWDWTFTGPTEAFDQSHTGFFGGAQAGLQKQWSRMVVGAEVSYSWADINGSSASLLSPGETRRAELSNLLMVTGRLGVTQDNILAYFKGGYVTAEVEFRSGTPVAGTSSSGREHGWVAGIGMDYGLSRHITIGVEYNYLHLNVDARDQTPFGGAPTGSQVVDAGFDIQTVMARLNFKLGGRDEVPYR